MAVSETQQKQFISKIAPLVQKYAPKYGIKVCSPIIAQACLESAYGTSDKAKHHNYFGLKYRKNRVTCNKGYFEDGGSEQNSDGSYTNLSEDTTWYSFDSMEKCVEGYFQFINIKNYASLKGVTDPLTYLKNIKSAGYATSIKYVNNVYNVITDHNLTQYDTIKSTTTSSSNNNNATSNIIVAIDSGHGSNTGGKRHPDGYREHYSNTYVAYYLDKILQANGIKTVKVAWDDTNATDDEDVSLGARQAQIKKAGCTISVSIHANAYGDGKSYNSANGVETFYHTSNFADSRKLAQCVQNQLLKGTPQKNRGVKTGSLAMCNCAAMNTKASILVETAFMTNKTESDLLKSDVFNRECAKEIAQGIFDYFGISGNTNINVSAPCISNSSSTTTNTSSSSSNSSKKYMYNNLDYSPVFNPTYYNNKYSDLKKAFGTDTQKLFNHFIKYGMKEGRQASSTFNPIIYRDRYSDLKKAFGTNYPEYYKHYIVYGKKEGRKAY